VQLIECLIYTKKLLLIVSIKVFFYIKQKNIFTIPKVAKILILEISLVYCECHEQILKSYNAAFEREKHLG